MEKQKLAIIFGTRPEIIKLAPIIWACQKRNLNFFCVHTGQHFSFEMDKMFFNEFELPEPKHRLNVGSRALIGHGAQTGAMISEIEAILLQEMPDVVIVQGDTNSVLAGALSAAKISKTKNGKKIAVAHIEAGLRSYDDRMPEELNRVLTDNMSSFLFVPTKRQQDILLAEGFSREKIFVTGNTIVDVATQFSEVANKKSVILKTLGVKNNAYMLLTLHRQENTDHKDVLANIIDGISQVVSKALLPVIFPIHPRTEKKLLEFGLRLPKEVKIIKPVGYSDFLALELNAKLILTDSGGVQEEACILKVPCITLSANTERPETVDVGANCISGPDQRGILVAYHKMIGLKREWANPFGDGRATERILDILLNVDDFSALPARTNKVGIKSYT